MSSENQTPFFGGHTSKADRYSNPFYGIPRQFIPLNVDGMLWWADVFLIRFGFYRSALSRVANYFITGLTIECEDEEAKKEYEEIFENLGWRAKLGEIGLNLLAYGNCYVSVTQSFNRFLICEKCGKVTIINRVDDYKFDKGQYSCKCKRCGHNGSHKVVDKYTKDSRKLRAQIWNPREIKIRYENTTDEYEYYWDIPQAYKTKILQKNNKFYSKKTPLAVYDCVIKKQMLAFNEHNFIHMHLPTPAALKSDGRAIPPCIYMFDDFFMLKVLQRFNEAICYEDINPFRVLAMAPEANSLANPILNQSGSQWKDAVTEMIDEHRLDPGSYHTFPFPLNYQQLGGQGKELAPTDLMAQAVSNILNALNIPQELYTMNLQMQAAGPALRLFENSWAVIPDNYNKFLQHMADVIGKTRGLASAKVSLIKVTMSDDMERKSVIGQLVSANTIARSELLGLFNLDYKEQLRKKMQEDLDAQELQQEEQERQQIKNMSRRTIFGQNSDRNVSPQDVQSQAQELAQQLLPLPAEQIRAELQKIKAQDKTLWSATKTALEEARAQARTQGVDQAKQQGQPPQQ